MPKYSIKLLPILLLPLAAAGCVSVEDQREMDAEKCASYGFLPNTDAFARCMMKQDDQREAEERRSRERREAERRERKEEERWERREKQLRESRRDDIDRRPSFDRDGNPNFDTDGNYQGCHGIGCMVDNPEVD